MIRELHAWLDGRLLGTFFETPSGAVAFDYEPDATVPISLSLPLSGGWEKESPLNFLDGLLPEDGNERLRMSMSLDARDDTPFSLLDAVDATGGLVFTSSDELPKADHEPLQLMSPGDLAGQISSHSHSSNWFVEDPRARFSLAGAQGKFTIAMLGSRMYWPSASLPSTHIVKPEPKKFPGCAALEHFGESLAPLCGVPAPATEIIKADGLVAFSIERFDRVRDPDGYPVRLRTEDLTQAMGLPPSSKYDIALADIAALLKARDLGDALIYGLFQRVAYNTYIGNCDAHAKNYSLFLTASGVSLCPVYDSLPTRAYPGLDASLAMSVNEKWYAEEIGLMDWEAEAKACGLDPVRVSEDVGRVCAGIRDNALIAAGELDEKTRGLALKVLDNTFSTILGDLGGFTPVNPPDGGLETPSHGTPVRAGHVHGL